MTEKRVFDYKFDTEPYEVLSSMGVVGISKLQNGKPVAENCFISVSHSDTKCAVCKSENPVGIDIEKIEDRKFDSLVERFFSDNEKEYYNKNKTSTAFYEIWTRKEAFSKITGEGIKEIFKLTDTFSLDGYNFQTEKLDGYILTVCEMF